MSALRRFPVIKSSTSSKNEFVITDPRDVTPEWATAVLNRDESLRNSEVTAVRVILSKGLQVSTVHRLALEYRGTPHDRTHRPGTLFLKLCREPQDTGDQLKGISRAEVDFYKTVAPTISCPPLVRSYDAVFSRASGRSHLLLEDLSETHSQQDQNSAPSEDMSRLAVEAMAKIQARWWSSPQLGDGIGKVLDKSWLRTFLVDLNTSVNDFLEGASGELTKTQKEAYARMLDAAPRIWGRLTDPRGLTVTHGDCHWWNFLYPNNSRTHSVRMFDWQLWHLDLGARDLAFLLALGGFAESRAEIETDLLRVYHDALIANGVSDYSWEMLNEDYRWSAIRNLNIPVIFRALGKHESTWKTALRRAYDSYQRLECAELTA